MSRRRSRSPSPGRYSRSCSSNDPRDLERRIFVGNLPTSDMEKKDLEDIFSPYGKIVGVSMFRGFGFVQFERIEEAEAAKAGQKGRLYKGYKIDVNMAVERRQAKARQSPPRRDPYGSYGDGREPRPRSRSPVYGREGRDGREPRPSAHPRDHEGRYRGSESREKEPRAEPRGDPVSRDPSYRDGYERYYRSESAADDYYRKKEDHYRDPWGGRRAESEVQEERSRPGERRRNDLYRQFYEELHKRYERPVDCSVIVVNKAQKEYAETVGRKVRDLGMVVDLIFLNTEVSLTQALEDVGRARTPFAIIITQQHQVHRSCTVNILFGTPQEHRNMPMQDAMVLVAHNYDAYKVEHREKEREEIARKAAKIADDVLLREPDRENHPISLLTPITLLAENRFMTPEELDSIIVYLKDKRERLVRSSADPHAAAASLHDVQAKSQGLPPAARPTIAAALPTHVGIPSSANPPPNPSHQQELQAKILSLFNSGTPAPAAAPAPTAIQPQAYSSSLGAGLPPPQTAPMLGARPPAPRVAPSPGQTQGYAMLAGQVSAPAGGQRQATSASGINFDNPSVQKALDTLIQSGPSLNHLVNSGAPQPTQVMGQGVSQAPAMSMYPRHY